MKALTTPFGNFGPYKSITVGPDRYYCGDVEILFSAVGTDGVIVEADTVTWPAPAPVVPESVTRRQAKQALALNGLLSSVQPALDAIPDATQRTLMQIEWDDSQVFERHRPSLIALATALGLSSAQFDALFTQAAAL